MRKPVSASADAEKTRGGMARGITPDITQGIATQGIAHDLATEIVCLALLLALAALVCRIASIW
jgi:hypothetical protein